MSYLVELGNKIRRRRIELGMTQHELALRSGYTSRSSINKLELGHVDPSLTKLYELAEALEMSPVELAFNAGALYELADGEKIVVDAYRNDPKLRFLIDRMATNSIDVQAFYSAACSDDGSPDQYIVLNVEAAERLKNAPETDDPLL